MKWISYTALSSITDNNDTNKYRAVSYIIKKSMYLQTNEGKGFLSNPLKYFNKQNDEIVCAYAYQFWKEQPKRFEVKQRKKNWYFTPQKKESIQTKYMLNRCRYYMPKWIENLYKPTSFVLHLKRNPSAAV